MPISGSFCQKQNCSDTYKTYENHSHSHRHAKICIDAKYHRFKLNRVKQSQANKKNNELKKIKI